MGPQLVLTVVGRVKKPVADVPRHQGDVAAALRAAEHQPPCSRRGGGLRLRAFVRVWVPQGASLPGPGRSGQSLVRGSRKTVSSATRRRCRGGRSGLATGGRNL